MKFVSAICALSLLILTGCGTGEESRRTLRVFAAASLSDVFAEVKTAFSESDPDVDLQFSFAGSADLVSQISEGAPADVVATADEATMSTLRGQELLADAPTVFAANTLTLAVGKGNPKSIRTSADLDGKALVVCAPQVPCGAATTKWAKTSGTVLNPVSEENSVTDVLGKVRSGQADAGIVYVTDVRRAESEVDQVELPGSDAAVNRYPAAAVKGGNQADAAAFIDFLRSAEARKILTGAGFTTP